MMIIISPLFPLGIMGHCLSGEKAGVVDVIS